MVEIVKKMNDRMAMMEKTIANQKQMNDRMLMMEKTIANQTQMINNMIEKTGFDKNVHECI